ncbi:MAG: hypothetical protein ABI945_04500 [Nitrospirales bacterium]
MMLSTLTLAVLALTFVGQGRAGPEGKSGEEEVWGRVVRLEGDQTLVLEDPAGLEVKLLGTPGTFRQVRRGNLIKALVDAQGKVLFIEVVDHGQTKADHERVEKSKE